jgi:hypothetical protein
MSEHIVALFEGDPTGSGLRLLARSRDPKLVRQVRQWFAADRRAEVTRLEREGEVPCLREVRLDEGPEDPERRSGPGEGS